VAGDSGIETFHSVAGGIGGIQHVDLARSQFSSDINTPGCLLVDFYSAPGFFWVEISTALSSASDGSSQIRSFRRRDCFKERLRLCYVASKPLDYSAEIAEGRIDHLVQCHNLAKSDHP
jgi:hypothetical protein